MRLTIRPIKILLPGDNPATAGINPFQPVKLCAVKGHKPVTVGVTHASVRVTDAPAIGLPIQLTNAPAIGLA